jgi:tRNA threonylcarbamoyladenosine biosynthesis protein TsaB
MLILQIETATSVCSCALSLNGKTIAIKEINQINIHIEKITLLIEALLKESNYSFGDIDAVAVSRGPGSYTGLRIGVSTAKGLCYALDIPLISVNTLDAMAKGFVEKHQEDFLGFSFCPMIDARRMEVYSAVYDSNLNQIEPVEARIIDESSFEYLSTKSKVVIFGDGAEKFTDLFIHNEGITVFKGFVNSAGYLSEIAFEKAQKKVFENVAYFEPLYLKDFVPTLAKNKKGPSPVL